MTLVLSSSIFGPAFVDADVAALLSDEAFFRSLVRVESALASAQAELGIIPRPAAEAIAAAAAALPFDPAALAAEFDGYAIERMVREEHRTPAARIQPFTWLLLHRTIRDRY